MAARASLLLWACSLACWAGQASRLELRGQEAREAGDLDAALALIDRAMAIRERARRREPLALARTLHRRAGILYERDQLASALADAQRAMALLQEHTKRATQHLALDAAHRRIRQRRGRLTAVDPLGDPRNGAFGPRMYEKQEQRRLTDLVTDQRYERISLAHTIGLIQRARGDYQGALRALLPAVARAHEFHRAGLPPSRRIGWYRGRASGLRQQVVGNLAGAYRDQANAASDARQYRTAVQLYTKGLEAWSSISVTEHPDIALTLAGLGDVYLRDGRRASARALLDQAQAMQRALEATGHELDSQPAAAAIQLLQARLEHSEGTLERAGESYRAALAQYQRQLGGQHPDVVRTITRLAMLHRQRGDLAGALELAEHAEDLRGATADRLLATGSTREKRRFMALLGEDIDRVLSLAAGVEDPRGHALVALTLLRYKGRILDSMSSSLASLRQSIDTPSATLLADYQELRSRHASRWLRGPDRRGRRWHAQQLDQLEQRLRHLEAAISQESRAFSARRQAIAVDAVRAALPDGAALIEWARYQPRGDRLAESGEQYIGCVVRSRAQPACVPLGAAQEIDALAVRLHQAASTQFDLRTPARDLAVRIIDPLLRYIDDSDTLLLAPDGALHVVPMAALLDEHGRSLVTRYRLLYLTSGRELVRHRHRPPPGSPPVVVAAPDYGVASDRFRPLEGTVAEARILAELLPEAAILTGRRASEQRLDNLHGPSILHIATHGYHEPRTCAGEPLAVDAGRDVDPLLSVGLALAGANGCRDPDDVGEDGLLTAHELAALDLHGTQLAVLSACGTGLGDADVEVAGERATLFGEGLYSLRRALVMAGARTQLVTLWKIDDRGTKHVIQEFYRHLLDGAKRADALRHVQLDLQRRGVHPYYWAGFVLSGEDGALVAPSGAPPRTSGDRPSQRGCACASTSAPDAILWLLLLALYSLRRRQWVAETRRGRETR